MIAMSVFRIEVPPILLLEAEAGEHPRDLQMRGYMQLSLYAINFIWEAGNGIG